MVTSKNDYELDRVFVLLKAGFTKSQVKEKLDIKSTTLANRLRRLEESNNIKRVGKFRIDIISSSYQHLKVTKNEVHFGFNKRGHAHNITIHFAKKIDFWELPKVRQDKKLKILKELKIKSLKFVKKGFTIWINKHTLTLYSNNSYYSKDALRSKFSALRDADTLVQNLILKYDFPRVYGIEVFREHYGLIFNKFAKWLNKRGRKMYVQDKKGKSILWVDKSRKDDVGLDEFEGEDPIKINNADDFFSSKDKTGWKDDTLDVDKNKKKIANHDEVIDKSMKVLEGYAEQIALHLEVEQRKLILTKNQLSLTEKQTEQIDQQNKIFKEIRDRLKPAH